ncbi:MAG: aminotransferase class I/II-fold pyridoxal phosphate-dependent enzyme [Nitrososphaeria archaeon]|nr:aminotransferase class I/II-fold pyridoxal phosphate-dependent enzyme [Nitrososphaeria archaeon]NIQ32991.1 aminotransferase class I/II-fold pyridoxal phosphate-dependent enzyme [Nitrososphaeria archaeon]
MPIRPSSRWSKGVGAMARAASPLTALKREFKQKGEEIIDLQAGDPVIWGHINQPLSESLLQAVEEGSHMYPGSTDWFGRLREAISSFERVERGIDCSPKDVILTPGCAAAFNVLHYTLLDRGDEVVCFEPYHYLAAPTSYFSYFGARVVSCLTDESKDWEPDLDELRSRVTDKAKAIFVNSPNNPTGAVYRERLLRDIADIAGEHDLPIISDEIYGLITYDGVEAESTAAVAGDVPVMAISGMSKFFVRPGWRLGYIIFHDPQEKIAEIQDTMRRVATAYGHMTSCIPTPILAAAARIYKGSIETGREMVEELQVRRDFTFKRLNEIEGMSCTKPQGALYAFPRLEEYGEVWKTEEDLLSDLLREEKIALDTGSWYGKSGKWHFRTLILPEVPILEDAYNRLEMFLKRHT